MTLTIKKYFNLLRIICYSWFAMNDMAKPGVKNHQNEYQIKNKTYTEFLCEF